MRIESTPVAQREVAMQLSPVSKYTLGALAALVLGGYGLACAPSGKSEHSVGLLAGDAATRVYVPPGSYDEYYSFLSGLSLIHISEPTRQAEISYAVFCLK